MKKDDFVKLATKPGGKAKYKKFTLVKFMLKIKKQFS